MAKENSRLTVAQFIVLFLGSFVFTGLFTVIWVTFLGWLINEGFQFMDSPIGTALYLVGMVLSIMVLRTVSRRIRSRLYKASAKPTAVAQKRGKPILWAEQAHHSDAGSAPLPLADRPPTHDCSKQRWTKYLAVSVFTALIAGSAAIFWPSEEPMVSGKPVSHWVGKLEDRDPREWSKALDALRFCKKEDLGDARKRLREMAVGGNTLSRGAALILFRKFDEVDPKFADAYLVTNGDETFLYGSSAILALARVDMSAASAAMMRKFDKMPEPGPLRTDITKVAKEIIAIREEKQ
jgi:hypothetical protein